MTSLRQKVVRWVDVTAPQAMRRARAWRQLPHRVEALEAQIDDLRDQVLELQRLSPRLASLIDVMATELDRSVDMPMRTNRT